MSISKCWLTCFYRELVNAFQMQEYEKKLKIAKEETKCERHNAETMRIKLKENEKSHQQELSRIRNELQSSENQLQKTNQE